jgi:hypothetical protein
MVIVDAWENLDDFERNFLNYEKIHQNFCIFLDYIIQIEKNKGTKIYFISSGKEISANLNLDKNEIINDYSDLPKNFDEYFFCGFHIGQCIDREAIGFSKSNNKKITGVVLNLSQLSPESPYAVLKDSYSSRLSYYYWTYEGFEKID